MAIPGSSTLIGGDIQAGYYGIIPSSELITGSDLTSAVGITEGTSQNSSEEWLKFAYKGKIQFVSKKIIRSNITWDHINSKGCVFGKSISINGLNYLVRLMRGSISNPAPDETGSGARGSEWNQLMLPIHINAPNSWQFPQYTGLTQDWGINFTDSDLETGSYSSWCQETPLGLAATRIARGAPEVSKADNFISYMLNSTRGWRPVLELQNYVIPTWTPPGLSPNINGVYKAYSDGFVKIDGVWRQIDEIHMKINDIWRKS